MGDKFGRGLLRAAGREADIDKTLNLTAQLGNDREIVFLVLRQLMPVIQTLNLTENQLDPASTKLMADALKTNAERRLDEAGGGGGGGDGSAGDRGSTAEGANGLTTLILSDNLLCGMQYGLGTYDGSGLQALFDALMAAPLVELNLSGNELGPSGAAIVARALREQLPLKLLSLKGNSLGSDGARTLAPALRGNSTLKELDLSDNSLSSSGATHLADALKANHPLATIVFRSKLIKLDVRGNNIMGEAAERLKLLASPPSMCRALI